MGSPSSYTPWSLLDLINMIDESKKAELFLEWCESHSREPMEIYGSAEAVERAFKESLKEHVRAMWREAREKPPSEPEADTASPPSA